MGFGNLWYIISPFRWARALVRELRNLRRRRRRDLEYILIRLPSELPPLPESRSWL
ncbi:MAG: hypothetical protein JNL34_03190, partial [Anaerolineae bacterium]|nr:hypothetical protein [Anaerolineae bacterium]